MKSKKVAAWKNTKAALAAAVLSIVFIGKLSAHHSFSAEFDSTKPVTVTGVLTKVEWENPHIWIYLDVKDTSGKVTNWGFSGGPPGVLQHRGITKSSLKLGEVIKVEGFRAKDGSSNASSTRVTFADGRNVFAGSAEDTSARETK